MPTSIEWVKNPDGSKGETWNPQSGCRWVSEGCTNCYAARLAATRLKTSWRYEGLTVWKENRWQWTGRQRFLGMSILGQPLHWTKPRTIFVCSMSDLFYSPVSFIARVFNTMLDPWCKRHRFIILTKRAERMRQVLAETLAGYCTRKEATDHDLFKVRRVRTWLESGQLLPDNIIGMVSAETQHFAMKRIPELLASPFQTRGVSLEPLLGPIDVRPWLYEVCCRSTNPPERGCNGPGCMGTKLDWVIVGPETGPHARMMDDNWARTVRDQCLDEDTHFFYKKGKLDGVLYHGFPFHVARYSG